MCFRCVNLFLLAAMLVACAPAEGIRIIWSTASEFNTAGFIVERSDNGDVFQPVSMFIPASDDPLVGHDYQFTDRDVQPGRAYYYRLMVIHNDNSRSEFGRLSARAP
jgi:phosphodiesterase/alkaline phosphatase D-like protein